MPSTDETSRRFELQPELLRRQRRILRVALAWYLPGGVIVTGLVAWSAGQPAAAVATTLIVLSAAQIDYYAVVVVVQLWLVGRDLCRAGTPPGELVLDDQGVHDGHELILWRDVAKVRVRRRGVPHVAVAGRGPGGRRRKRAFRDGYYGVGLDELAAAFEQHAPVIDPGRPRKPARDDQAGTFTFFVNHGDLRARRHRYLRSVWQLPLMLCPASAGLFIVRQPLAGALVLTVLCGLVLRQCRKIAKLARPLRLSRAGLGRLLLTPDHLKLAGTDVAIPWSHIQGASLTRQERPGLDALVACPDPDPVPRCRFRNRRIPVHIAESLYCTTADDIGAAFAHYTQVDARGHESAAATG